MNIYIALLRGINVGGKNIIKMAELKKVLEASGLTEVKTYIQSGNILFKANEDEETLRNKIESEIKKNFNLSIPVILRTASQLDEIILNCPFSEKEISKAEAASDAESLYVAILHNSPLQENIDIFDTYKSQEEEYRIIGREVFLLFNNSIRNSKLASNLHRLDKSATVRNWKTINKLSKMAGEDK